MLYAFREKVGKGDSGLAEGAEGVYQVSHFLFKEEEEMYDNLEALKTLRNNAQNVLTPLYAEYWKSDNKEVQQKINKVYKAYHKKYKKIMGWDS